MRVRYVQVDELPRLAWLISLATGTGEAEVLHGPWVETRPDFFCAGVWSGRFEEGRFESAFLAGSGARIDGNRLVVCTPNHMLNRLFYKQYKNQLLISNSVAFLLTYSGDEPAFSSVLYHYRLNSVVRGVHAYSRWLPTRSGDRIYMVCHRNLVVDRNLKVRECPKPEVGAFSSFSDYRQFLERVTRDLGENASDPSRKIRYKPIASISSGYDSPLASVFARLIGCDTALTFRNARHLGEDGTGLMDSGKRIAEHLGMKVKEFDRTASQRLSGFPEIETFGNPENMLAWADELPATMLFTGFHGGGVWSSVRSVARDNYVRGDSGGSMLSEFSLRVGFVQVPPSFFSGPRIESIYRISRSDEMKRWRLGGKYDRPIARRILEEAGIPRSWFGYRKKAVAMRPRADGLAESMTPQSFRDFQDFCAARWNRSHMFGHAAFSTVRRMSVKFDAMAARAERTIKRRIGRDVRLPRTKFAYKETGLSALLFHWSMHHLRPRYEVAVNRKASTLETTRASAESK